MMHTCLYMYFDNGKYCKYLLNTTNIIIYFREIVKIKLTFSVYIRYIKLTYTSDAYLYITYILLTHRHILVFVINNKSSCIPQLTVVYNIPTYLEAHKYIQNSKKNIVFLLGFSNITLSCLPTYNYRRYTYI